MEGRILIFHKTRVSFLVLLFSLLLNPQASAMSNKESDIWWYAYSWGGIMTTCLHYDFNRLSKEYAQQTITIMFETAKENIINVDLYEELIQKVEKSCSLVPIN